MKYSGIFNKQIAVVLFGLFVFSGCVATQDWVKTYLPEQLLPLNKRISDNEASINQVGGRVSGVEGQVTKMAGQIADLETRLSQTNAKADRALESLQRLKPERKMVLHFTDGARFATNSAQLSAQAKKDVDSFLSDAKGSSDDGGNFVFVVAGHSDSTGSQSYNYELSKRRAESIAAYLVTEGQLEPTQVIAVGYGERVPVADNSVEAGRARNRRVEILLYRDSVGVASTGTASRAATQPR